jgi:predicted enzyme related to lactoylglutathione lyase
VNITKTYFMLPVTDMDRAGTFYRDALGLTEAFASPEWTELTWGRDAIEDGSRLVAVADTEGNRLTIGAER